MAAKRGKKPARSVRYLLSADQKLRKLSLRKMADPGAKAKSQNRSARVKSTPDVTSAPDTRSSAAPRIMSGRAMMLGVVCIVGAAALLTARQPSPAPQPNAASVDAHLQSDTTLSSDVVLPDIPTSAVTKSSVAKQASASVKPSAPKAPVVKTTVSEPPKPTVAKAVPKPAATEPAEPDGEDTRIVTVTGCVDRSGDTYRLKNASGADAPKSRSWRSGFLKQRVAPIDLVEASSTLRLSDHVGQRVAATGALVDREMRVRSLTIVSSACN